MPTAISDWSTAMMTSLGAALAMFLSAIPKIIGFAIILIVGWLLSSLVEKGVAALLRAVRFNDLAAKSGFAGFVSKMNSGPQAETAGAHGGQRSQAMDPAGMIGLVAKWFIRLIAAVVAFDALGLPAVSEVLRELLLWLPNVIVALVVLVIGGLAARALSNLVRGAAGEAGLSNANLLAKVASALVWSFAIVVAVNQIGIATALVNTLFMAFVGAIALGLGLAFGLGGRETAGQIVSKWYGKAQENAPKLAHAAEAGGEIARSQAAGAASTLQGGSGGGYQGGGSSGGGSTGGGGYGGGSTGGSSGGYGGGSSGGGSAGGNYPSSGGGRSSASGPQYPTDDGPRGGSGAGAQEGRDQMYPTPSSPRHPSES
ncbi:small-conductance mechanosensitive ion channel [Ramlibacter henchirensis]|uniref:Small-conductance mechanosensitive ion channel n=1 Tax=Ramlibacter henchirensis TaxID=204072 RepID=A0A4Z0BS99_9BURK|nr:small-conductance mechanosensitive ion channel [Ramlibacter henchirensis]TFZ02163.1 small-conductance mechanosensitive ion channel [Ramlibacter henchirensis]